MNRARDQLATTSLNSRALGGFLFLAGLIITFGTYGFGIVIGGPLMLMGIAFPIWKRSLNNKGTWTTQNRAAKMTQEEAARSGGVVMSQDEAARVAYDNHQETRQARRNSYDTV